MPDPVQPSLDELEALQKAASPLPWWANIHDQIFRESDRSASGPAIAECLTDENAAYIVAACNSLPSLVEEVRRLRDLESTCSRCQTTASTLISQDGCAVCENRRLERENQGLRKLLADERERCAKIAEGVRGGFTANVRTAGNEQELIRDIDGPWVLNSDVAAAIRNSGTNPQIDAALSRLAQENQI